ncbi:MAG TPA: hypothetical protein VFS11_05425 [Gemmatimonadales bacterium]|nr:hypothetical protein [Gemmatimonadales bacterium]
MLALLLLLQAQVPLPDTLVVRAAAYPPAAGERPDSAELGSPQVRLGTAQGDVLGWLIHARDSVYLAVLVPDSTPGPGDAVAVSLNIGGERSAHPDHADFQWIFQRTLDSSVVYRGKSGRWQPPRDDPDWRLGAARTGAGWAVTSAEGPRWWSVVLRLDPAWLDGVAGSLPAIAFRVTDGHPRAWYSWPSPPAGRRALDVEGTPSLWVPVRR